MENTKKKNSFWQNYKSSIILLAGIIIGSIIGLVNPDLGHSLAPLGDIFINLMFTVVVPLVFLSVSSAVTAMADLKKLGRILKNLAIVFVVTGAIASICILVVVKLFPPAAGFAGDTTATSELEEITLSSAIVDAVTVGDFSEILSRSHMLALIVFAIFFAVCVIMTDKDGKINKGLELLNNVFMKMVSIIMLYAPIGLGCYFADLVATYGQELIGNYARAMVIYYPLCIAYFFIAFAVYSFWAGNGIIGTKVCFKYIIQPAITALATCSSIATLPVNLDAAKKMGVSKDVREIVLPLGATMHMDGTCLSSILKISFLFGVFNQDFSGIGTYLTAILLSVLGGVVMSGVPGGGLIGEMLICNLYGFPPEAFPIIAAIGFLVDPPATMVNAAGDSVASMMVTRLTDGKDWLKKKVAAGEVEL